MNPNKNLILPISPNLMNDFLCGRIKFDYFTDLPKDTKVVDTDYDHVRNIIRMTINSDSFPEVGDGEIPDEISTAFMTYRIDMYAVVNNRDEILGFLEVGKYMELNNEPISFLERIKILFGGDIPDRNPFKPFTINGITFVWHGRSVSGGTVYTLNPNTQSGLSDIPGFHEV